MEINNHDRQSASLDDVSSKSDRESFSLANYI